MIQLANAVMHMGHGGGQPAGRDPHVDGSATFEEQHEYRRSIQGRCGSSVGNGRVSLSVHLA